MAHESIAISQCFPKRKTRLGESFVSSHHPGGHCTRAWYQDSQSLNMWTFDDCWRRSAAIPVTITKHPSVVCRATTCHQGWPFASKPVEAMGWHANQQNSSNMAMEGFSAVCLSPSCVICLPLGCLQIVE